VRKSESRDAKKGCAQCRDHGFIPVVKTGGEVILLPQAD